MSEISQEKIENNLIAAIKFLFKRDYFLLEHGIHERTISSRLAMYLQPLFPKLHVDCEYNKKGIDVKQLDGIKECNEQKKTNRILPDIIIHKRNSSENLVVIEVKSFDGIGTDCDIKKLKLLTDIAGKYKYELGYFINFIKLNDSPAVEIKVFKNGHYLKILACDFFIESKNQPYYLNTGAGGYKTVDTSQLDQMTGDATDMNDYDALQGKYLSYDENIENDHYEQGT